MQASERPIMGPDPDTWPDIAATLQESAEAVAAMHGHSLGEWSGAPLLQTAACERCGRVAITIVHRVRYVLNGLEERCEAHS